MISAGSASARLNDARMPEPPLVEFTDVEKSWGGPAPLRIARLRIGSGDRFVIRGLDAAAAETLVNLITGASLPDTGEVKTAGQNTRTIATDTDWLVSLDRFGIVTPRALLIGALPIAANLAMPLTLSIDPLAPEIQSRVETLARDAGLLLERLASPASTLSPVEVVRTHIARALALGPKMLIVEHPTAGLPPPEAIAIAHTIRTIVSRDALSLLALSNDEAFAGAIGAARLRYDPTTGGLSMRVADRLRSMFTAS